MAKKRGLANSLDPRQKRMLAAGKKATRRVDLDTPNLITQKSVMKRQQKSGHRKTGK